MATSNPKDPNNNKMKGLLKGLRYISQIFDDNKDQGMQIGYPTDVKHVAHIGWDGPSTANSPSWMNEFQGPPGTASAPLGQNGEKDDHGVKWVSEDSSRKSAKGSKSPAQDILEVPKASRRHSSSGHGGGGGGGGGPDSPKKEKSDKSKQTRRSSKTRESSDKGIRQATDSSQGIESSQNLPDIPKKTRRKKSKESSIGGSSRKIKTLGSSEIYSDQPGPQKSFQVGEGKGFT